MGDPNLTVYSIKKDTIFSVLERYWRWYGGTDEKFTLKDYWHAIKASFLPMIQDDIRANDWRSAFISFLCPHYGLLRHLYRKLSGKIQKLSWIFSTMVPSLQIPKEELSAIFMRFREGFQMRIKYFFQENQTVDLLKEYICLHLHIFAHTVFLFI